MAIQGPYINQVEGIAIAQNTILPLEVNIDNASNKADNALNEALLKIPITQIDAVNGIPIISNVPLLSTYNSIRELHGMLKSNVFSTTDIDGDWIYDADDITTEDDGGFTLVTIDGKRIKRKDRIVYPDFFGAKGDGVTDDTLAIQKAIDYLSKKSNGELCFSHDKDYLFTEVVVSTPKTNVNGNGATLRGFIRYGLQDTPKTYNSTIEKCYFKGDNSGIKILHVRRLKIASNVFDASDKAIQTMDTSIGFHTNAQINIIDNLFFNVDYSLYVDRNGVPLDGNWTTNSDFKYCLNTINVANVNHIWAKGLDGMEVVSNVDFFTSSTTLRDNKRQHIRIIDQSDWIIVTANNFFESGWESIYVTNGKKLTITGNNFAWSGQAGYYSCIKVDGIINDGRYTITGNTFDRFSGHCLDFRPTGGTVTFVGNSVHYADTFTNYFGTIDLSAYNHFMVRSVPAGNVNLTCEANSRPLTLPNFMDVVRGVTTPLTNTFSVLNANDATSSSYINGTTDGSGKITIGAIRNAGMNIVTYSGQIRILARRGNLSTAKNGTYTIEISKSDVGDYSVIETSKSGAVNGISGSDPSFYFTIESDFLIANSIGSTTGDFVFNITTFGNIQIGQPITLASILE